MENGETIESLPILLRDYLRSWFIIDVFSIFPFDFILQQENISDFAKLPRIIKLLKIIRLIKFSNKLSKTENTKKLSNILRGNKETKNFFSFFILIIILTHITCCLWYFLVKIEDSENWFSNLPFVTWGNLDKYIVSFYWAISTICTVGFGDIYAVTSVEKVFNIIWICVGVAFYSYTIGTLSSILNYTNKKKSLISS